MELLDKLSVLSDAAKYDAACTSSGAKRGFEHGKIGCTSSGVMGCCHSFSADGRCITLLKVLLSNDCMYDCKYCVNRRTNETRRATFTPEELADGRRGERAELALDLAQNLQHILFFHSLNALSSPVSRGPCRRARAISRPARARPDPRGAPHRPPLQEPLRKET